MSTRAPNVPKGWRRLRPGEHEKRGDRFWAFYTEEWAACGPNTKYGFPFEVVIKPVDNAPFVIRRVKPRLNTSAAVRRTHRRAPALPKPPKPPSRRSIST